MSVGERLRTWLRSAAVAQGGAPERDYLPHLSGIGWAQPAAGGVDRDVGPAEFAAGLLTVARDGDPDMRAAAVDALGVADARWWLVMDETLRQRWWDAPRWSRSLAMELADGDVDLLRLVVAGCHHDGRIREAAVARLADHRTHSAVVAVLALRACDWVAEVRGQARTAVDARLSPSGGSALTTLAEMAFALRGRREGAWLAERVEALLRDLPPESLEPLLSARDRRSRRAAYRAAIAADRLGPARLAVAAVRDDDLPIRTMCARAAVQNAVDPSDVRGLLASRTALVRAEALHVLTMAGDLDVAETALVDRHPAVRAIAQAALRRAGEDPAPYYRRLVAHEEPAPGVIAGIGETGGPEDANLLTGWLSHPRARGRVEAIRALRRLGVVRPADLLPLLRDGSSAVTRQAVAALRHEIGVLDPSMLDALLRPGNPTHVRFAGYRLLILGDAWQRLATNLRLVDDPDQRLRVASRADIAAWLDRQAATTYHLPTRDRSAELDNLIQRAQPILGEHRTLLLRFHASLTQPATP